jgi:hypothetical protein
MVNLTKGYCYLVITEGVGWIVTQQGQRSWTAMEFTEPSIWLDVETKDSVISGNSIFVSKYLENKNVKDYRRYWYSQKVQYRKDMFNILKYGSFEEPKEV